MPELLGFGGSSTAFNRRGNDHLAQGIFRAQLGGGSNVEHLDILYPTTRHDGLHLWLTKGEGPGLIQHNGSGRAQLFEEQSAFDDGARSGQPPCVPVAIRQELHRSVHYVNLALEGQCK